MAILEHERALFESPLHQPAMVPQILELLHPAPGQTAIDFTVGTGGHSLALAAAIGPDGLLVGIDADGHALQTAGRRLAAEAPCQFKLFPGRFSRAPHFARRAGVDAFDVALADLGVGTHQLEQPERGFSFDSDRKLDMRYDTSAGPTAWDAVNRAPEQELADIFHRYGEERFGRQIAARICRQRDKRPINSPAELADLVKGVVARRSGGRRWRIHPATRVFMALRIHLNNELDELDALLELLPGLLRSPMRQGGQGDRAGAGRAVILTYHSLEARRVKHTWRDQEKQGLLKVLTPSPVKPSREQVRENPRIRSAQLRAAEKL